MSAPARLQNVGRSFGRSALSIRVFRNWVGHDVFHWEGENGIRSR